MKSAVVLRRWAILGALAVCAPLTGMGEEPSALPVGASATAGAEQWKTLCFNTDRAVVAVNNEGIWTSKGRVFDAEGRQRLPGLKLSAYGMLTSVAVDHDLIVAAGTPDPDGSLSYWIDAFTKDGRRLWAADLDPSGALVNSPISAKLAIGPQSGTVSVLMYGQAYESDGDTTGARHSRARATNLVELRSYSQDGKLLARRKLMHGSVAKAAFSATGELALAGTADHRIDLGVLTGPPQRWIRPGTAFVVRYDQDGHPQWDRAFTGPGRLSVNILFDSAGNLWTALFTCGARGAQQYSVVAPMGRLHDIIMQPFCTEYYVIDRSGSGDKRETASAPCSPLSWAKICPKTESPLFLRRAGFALLGDDGHVFGASRDPVLERQVLDLRSDNGEEPSYYVWPLTDAGPGVRLPGPVDAMGFFHDSLCMAVSAPRARLRCDRWVETTRSSGATVLCLPASRWNRKLGGPS
jgi:hypothetical protein